MSEHVEALDAGGYARVSWVPADEVLELIDEEGRGGIAIDNGSSTYLIVGTQEQLTKVIDKMKAAIQPDVVVIPPVHRGYRGSEIGLGYQL